jgi:hypothetical protein
MKKININLLVMMFVVGISGISVSAQNRLAFNRNNEANVTGSVSRSQPRSYVISARGGQQISISLMSDSASSMSIRLTNNATRRSLNDESAGETGDMSEKTFNASLPQDGDYTITIMSSEASAAEFELRVTKG